MKQLIKFEIKKIMDRPLTWTALILMLLLSVFMHFSSYMNQYATDGQMQGHGKEAVELDKKIAAKYEGVLTDEKVEQMLEELMPKSGPPGLSVIYLYQNSMQSAVAARFSDKDGNWNGLSVEDVFGKEEIKIGYVDGWLCAVQDMARIFFFFSFVVIIMLAPVFSGEYGGVENIILAGRYGRSKCATAKVIAGVLAAFVTTMAFVVINVALVFALYGKSGLDCSILFAPLTFTEGYIPFNITCGTLLKYRILLAFTGTLGVTGITLFFSALCKNQITALAAVSAVYILPAILPVPEMSSLFKLIVLSPMYQFLFVSTMAAGQIKDSLLYAIWALPVAIFLATAGGLASRKIFAVHQVKV